MLRLWTSSTRTRHHAVDTPDRAHQRRRTMRNHDNVLTAHFLGLSAIKPRISSRFAYRDRPRKASRKRSTTIRASCPIHATIWGCERNARTWCRGSSWQGTTGKTFLCDYVTTSSEMWGQTWALLKCISAPGRDRFLLLFSTSAYYSLIGEYFIICLDYTIFFFFYPCDTTTRMVCFNTYLRI